MDGYLDQPLAGYLDDAAAGKAAPGGGSVTGLVGALATTMASMAANFTAGREKYAAVAPQIQSALASLAEDRSKFLDLMHRDMTAYTSVLAAYKLPKGTEDEKAARREAIQAATKDAMAVPLEMTRVAIGVLQQSQSLASIANANLLSDVAVAAVLAEATYAAGRINVEVNLGGLADEAMVASIRADLDQGQQRAAQLRQACLDAIGARKG